MRIQALGKTKAKVNKLLPTNIDPFYLPYPCSKLGESDYVDLFAQDRFVRTHVPSRENRRTSDYEVSNKWRHTHVDVLPSGNFAAVGNKPLQASGFTFATQDLSNKHTSSGHELARTCNNLVSSVAVMNSI